ncbi:hypothetical protein HanIR_Chr12g0608151 [Helianthus annuus]|nr:hypothetical protein HanIR_Chr12g0608151 [Helianthus annuus]
MRLHAVVPAGCGASYVDAQVAHEHHNVVPLAVAHEGSGEHGSSEGMCEWASSHHHVEVYYMMNPGVHLDHNE